VALASVAMGTLLGRNIFLITCTSIHCQFSAKVLLCTTAFLATRNTLMMIALQDELQNALFAATCLEVYHK